MKDVIYRDDALNALYQCTPFDPKGIALLEKCESKIEAIPSADRPQEKTISVDTLIEILSDVKEAHRNSSEAEAVIVDVWDEVVDVLRGAKDDSGSID